MKTLLSTLSYPLRHPIVTLIVVILLLYATFFTALQLSPAAQRAFNNAAQSYGYATAAVVLSSAAETALELVKLENVELKKSAQKKQGRLDEFQKRTAAITKKHNSKMKKLIAKYAASQVIGIVPVFGDMAAIALAMDGTAELCSMFEELESTSKEYGLNLHLYTDTTCQKSDLMWGAVIRQAEVRQKYWADKLSSLWKVLYELEHQAEVRKKFWSNVMRWALE